MANEYNSLVNTAERLGCMDDSIISKAKEFLRILLTKGSVKTLSESAKIVLCLDLSTSFLGISFDKETAIKLSGLKKSAYQNNLHTVEKILDLDKPLTISNVCVQFGCTVVKDMAEEILEKYKINKAQVKDMEHPQYVTAAVFTACRLKNIKIQKSQFIAMSHLRPSQWKELLNDFNKLVETLSVGLPKKNLKNNENEEIMEVKDNKTNQGKECKEEVEPYEDWKKRILAEAYHAVKNEEKMQE